MDKTSEMNNTSKMDKTSEISKACKGSELSKTRETRETSRQGRQADKGDKGDNGDNGDNGDTTSSMKQSGRKYFISVNIVKLLATYNWLFRLPIGKVMQLFQIFILPYFKFEFQSLGWLNNPSAF
jgi:hypothetical protein